ncbi:hypothetical protein P4S72_19250 [Vibrio sp. PP-XX7]
MVIVTQGEATVSLDHQTCHVTQKAVIVIPSRVVHGFIFAPHTQGYVLTIAEPLINQSTNSRAVEFLNFVSQKARILRFKPTSRFFTLCVFIWKTCCRNFTLTIQANAIPLSGQRK